MAKINDLEGLTPNDLDYELQNGGKFVVYEYCISILILTFRRGSDIYFIRAKDSAIAKGLPYTLLSLVAGWWGFPWGPIYTIAALITNWGGGKNVTSAVLAALNQTSQSDHT